MIHLIRTPVIILLISEIICCNSCTKDPPLVTTKSVSNITQSSAVSGGTVTDNGGAEVTARGVCWGTAQNPDISSSKTSDGAGNGPFTSSITGLTYNTSYHVRAYATNSEGTAYGDDIPFTTNLLTLTDADGNIYTTVTIGTQIWMKENLRTTKFKNGSVIPLISDQTLWSNQTSSAYCWYNNDASTYRSTYGALYNWYTVSTGNLCPDGWHVPADGDWKKLEMYLGMSQEITELTLWRGTNEGSKLKSTSGWYQNGNGTNESGFTALPTGLRNDDGTFYYIGSWTDFWSSTEINSNNAWTRALGYLHNDIGRYEDPKKLGACVRCLRND
jgi:uncharacterized protein (TIGR02145 family)